LCAPSVETRRSKLGRALFPLLFVGISALYLAVWSDIASWMAVEGDVGDWIRKKYPRGDTWTTAWRVVMVFVPLTCLMASLAWFGQRALKIAGPRALPPLLLTSTAAILWLLGQTPLGQTLVPAPFLFLLLL